MLNKLQSFFERTVDKVENNTTSFKQYYYLFAAILSLRLTLEFFSSRRLFTFDDMLHIGLWFAFIVMAFLIQMHLFSGERIQKVAKLVIVFFTIALTAPIIDIIATGGIGAKMNYLSLRSWKDVAWSYITIGGSSLSNGATLGIRIEIGLLILASFNYIRTKRKSVLWAIAGAICIYTVLFLSGAVPLLLGYIVSLFKLEYQNGDQSTVLLLLTADIFLLFIAFICHSKKRINLVIKKMPWGSFVIAVLLAVTAAMLAIKLYPSNWTLTPTTIFWFPLLIMLSICIAMYTGLQASDDNDHNNELLKKGILLLMLIISAMISYRTLFAVILLWSLLYMLNEKPLQLKTIPVLRNVYHALIMLAAAFIGFCTFNAPMIGLPAEWIWTVMLSTFTAGMFAELNLPGSGIFSIVKSNAIQKIIVMLLICIGFIIADHFLLKQSGYTLFFFIAAIPSLLLVWFTPKQTQLISFTLAPAVFILLWHLINA